jgi:HEAT repeat protein
MLEQTIERLSHTDASVRFEAAKALGASKEPRAVEPLINALLDTDGKVQYAAVSGLIKLGDRSAANSIIELLLRQPDGRVWDLMKLGIGQRLRAGLLALIEAGDEAMSDRLTDALNSDSLDEQQQAFLIQALGRTRDPRVVEMLIDRLLQDTVTIQGGAADALGYIGDDRAVGPLLLFMNEEVAVLREVATEALGRIGHPSAYDALVAALFDEEEWVRRAGAEALANLGDRRAMEPLTALLTDESQLVQDAAFDAIRQLTGGENALLN